MLKSFSTLLCLVSLVTLSTANFIPAPFLTQVPFALRQGPACSNLYLSVPANGTSVAVAAVANTSVGGAHWTLVSVNDASRSIVGFALRNLKYGTYLAIPQVSDMNNCSPVVRAVASLDVSGWFRAEVGNNYPQGRLLCGRWQR